MKREKEIKKGETEDISEVPIVIESYWMKEKESGCVIIRKSNKKYILDPTESEIFCALDGKKTVEEIIRGLEVPKENVITLIQKLRDQKIVIYKSERDALWLDDY